MEQVAVIGVLAIDPPGEVRQQTVEHPRQELAVALAPDLGLALVHVQRRPRGHRRIDVAEVPLVRRDLAVGVQIPGAEQQLDLRLGEVDIERAVVIVAVQRRCRVPAARRPILPVDQQNIEPPVAVRIEEGASGPHGLRQPLLTRPA